MEFVKFCMEKYGFLYTSMECYGFVWKSSVFVWNLSSFGIESIDTWFGTLYFVYGLGLETPKLISC